MEEKIKTQKISKTPVIMNKIEEIMRARVAIMTTMVELCAQPHNTPLSVHAVRLNEDATQLRTLTSQLHTYIFSIRQWQDRGNKIHKNIADLHANVEQLNIHAAHHLSACDGSSPDAQAMSSEAELESRSSILSTIHEDLNKNIALTGDLLKIMQPKVSLLNKDRTPVIINKIAEIMQARIAIIKSMMELCTQPHDPQIHFAQLNEDAAKLNTLVTQLRTYITPLNLWATSTNKIHENVDNLCTNVEQLNRHAAQLYHIHSPIYDTSALAPEEAQPLDFLSLESLDQA
jgi:outer membrane murein-binding lipoprotein Lpp